MNTQNPTDLTAAAAQKVLKDFSLDTLVESAAEKALVRQALLMIADLSDYQNLGVCADTAEQGFSALASYLEALGYKVTLDRALSPSVAGAVYLKFNTKRESYYLDSYTGQYRGVLVSCQSSDYEEINGTYGHLPLDLFAIE